MGSVKGPLVAAVDHPRFVGGHPMAGSEQVGVDGAVARAVRRGHLGADPHRADRSGRLRPGPRPCWPTSGPTWWPWPRPQHDALVAVVSHVPHLTAATLMDLASGLGEEHAALLQLAAGGFRDMTRIAAGQPSIWPDICDDNAEAIVATLDLLIDALAAMRAAGGRARPPALLDVLGRAADARRGPRRARPRPEELVEVRIPVLDRTGAIAEIAVLAAELGVNIVDLEIAHSVEGDRGVIVLVVDTLSGPDPAVHPVRPRATGPPARRWGPPDDRRRRPPPAAVTETIAGGRRLIGTLTVPGDKSISHRALLMAALAEGTSTITGLSDGDDVPRTAGGGAALGAGVDATARWSRSPVGGHGCTPRSGRSTWATRAPACASWPGWSPRSRAPPTLTGDESLRTRPMDRVAEPLSLMGARVERQGRPLPAPAHRHRRAAARHRVQPPMASAQVKSAVLLAGLAADGETVVHEPVATRAHTEEMLAAAGADITSRARGPGTGGPGAAGALHRAPSPCPAIPPRPPSGWSGLPSSPAAWSPWTASPGGRAARVPRGAAPDGRHHRDRGGGRRLRLGDQLQLPPARAPVVEAEEIPSLDEVPILAVAAAVAHGTTRFHDVGELRVKESDRLAGTVALVGPSAASPRSRATTSSSRATGGPLRPGRVDAGGDHRMAMAAAMAGAACPPAGARPRSPGGSRWPPATPPSPRTWPGSGRHPRAAVSPPPAPGRCRSSPSTDRPDRASPPCRGPWPTGSGSTGWTPGPCTGP